MIRRFCCVSDMRKDGIVVSRSERGRVVIIFVAAGEGLRCWLLVGFLVLCGSFYCCCRRKSFMVVLPSMT